MKRAHLTLSLLLCLGVPAGLRAATGTPRYTNAQLVSINAQTRLVVIKNTEGKQQTLQLDDIVAGFEGLRAGDRVILTLREEPGMTRISSIVKSQASPAGSPATAPPSAVQTAAVASSLSAFADQVAALAQQAGQVDAVWRDFTTTCNVTLRSSYPEGRDWFSLWEEGSVQMDVSSGACRDLFNQVVALGEAVKAGMVRAEDSARKANLLPGDLRDTRRRYSMEWGGFGLPAPETLKP